MYLCVKVVVFAFVSQIFHKSWELFQQCGNFRFSLFINYQCNATNQYYLLEYQIVVDGPIYCVLIATREKEAFSKHSRPSIVQVVY